MSKRQVMIRGAVFDYEQKAPFARSGRSILGGLELDPTGQALKCHECGQPHPSLALHVKKHGLTVREYRLKHGLNLSTSLVSPQRQEAMRLSSPLTSWSGNRERNLINLAKGRTAARARRQTEELKNFGNRCRLQMIAAIQKLAMELAHTPTSTELAAAGLPMATLSKALGKGRINEIVELCGLEPNSYAAKFAVRYERMMLVELLRDARYRLGRAPKIKDCRAPVLPCVNTFKRAFGSWPAALDAAGFGLVARQRQAT